MAKQVVFLVVTDQDGNAEKDAACAHAGPLSGRVKSIEYITDNRLPFEPTVSFKFSGATSGVEVFSVANVAARATWPLDGPVLESEPIKVVVTDGGKGRAGTFVVTCA